MADVKQIGQIELIHLELTLEALRPGAEGVGGELLQAFEDLRAGIDQLWEGDAESRQSLYEQIRERMEALTGRVMDSAPDDTRPPEEAALSALIRWGGTCRAVARQLNWSGVYGWGRHNQHTPIGGNPKPVEPHSSAGFMWGREMHETTIRASRIREMSAPLPT